MVRRFRSGAGEVSVVDKPRVFRGSPVRKSNGDQVQVQSSQVSDRLRQLEQERLLISQQIAENNPEGGQIRSRVRARTLQSQLVGNQAEIDFYRQASSQLQSGQYFSDVNELTTQARITRTGATQRERSRIASGVKTPEQRRMIREGGDSKVSFIQTKNGEYAYYSDPKTGINTFITKEGELRGPESKEGTVNTFSSSEAKKINDAYKFNLSVARGETLGYSGLGLSQQQVRTRESLVQSGFIKEKSGRQVITAQPLYDVYTMGNGGGISLTSPRYFDTKQYARKGTQTVKVSGVGKINYYLGYVTTPQGVKALSTKAGYLTLKVGDFLADKTIQLFPKLAKYNIPAPITRRSAAEFIGFNYLSFGTARFTKTGVAQQSQYADEVVEIEYKGQIVKVLKSDVTRQQALTKFKELKLKEQRNIIKLAFIKDAEGNVKVYTGIKPLAKDIYKATNFLAESGISPKRSARILQGVFPKLFPKQQPPRIIAKVSVGSADAVQVFNVPQLKNVAQVQTSGYVIGQINPSAVGQLSRSNQQIRQKSVTRQQLRISQAFSPKIAQQSRTQQAFSPVSIQQSRQTSKTTVASISLLRTLQRPKQQEKTVQQLIPQLRQRNPLKAPSPSRSQETPRKPPRIPIIPFKIKPLSSSLNNLFSVQVRRRGKFRTIAVAPTIRKAFTIGRSKVSRTLAATFKVTRLKDNQPINMGTPLGFKKKKGLFIELPKYRLSTGSELKEIQSYRRRK